MSARVLLIVIDAATPRVVCPAIRTGLFPTLQRLVEAGTMHEQSVTIFPSITPAATTSIITGCYPFEHGIAGASWFDAARGEVAYYGDDFWVIAREGFGEFIRDFLLRLNGDRLTAPTLFELVERTGRTAACLNYLVYKGLSAHKVAIPPGLAALPGVPFTATVEGPSVLSLGDFVGPRTPRGQKLDEKGGILHRFGMDDESTGAMLRDLFAEGSQSDLTVAYFADNDYRSHEIGPYRALPVIGRIDDLLAEAFDAAGGMDRVLEDTYVIVTSDHGHCEISANATRSVIQLDELLGEFSQAALGSAWRRGDQIMICPNMRAAQIYMHNRSPERRRRSPLPRCGIRGSILRSGAPARRTPRRPGISSPLRKAKCGSRGANRADGAATPRMHSAPRGRGAATALHSTSRSPPAASSMAISPTRSSGSRACSISTRPATSGSRRSPDANSASPAAMPTLVARRTAGCTRSIRSAR